MSGQKGANIQLTGVVQGVGFRPFVYRLANSLRLSGSIRNTSNGIVIEVSGHANELDTFLDSLTSKAPPLAIIQDIHTTYREANGATQFEILPSTAIPGGSVPISADVAICNDCLAELFDTTDRRYLYPFINCTNCGPRFTIINDLPYDRPFTSMAEFPMCLECAGEYCDPLNRRFHAQLIACPVCGPQVWLEIEGSSQHKGYEAIAEARRLLTEGKIIAVKGLGGFHLACDATNPAVVQELRDRKIRPDKPLAVMMLDLEAVKKFCHLSKEETEVLTSRARPIVVLEKKLDTYPHAIASNVAPGPATLGILLPYTPLHYLLLQPGDGFPSALVMTSGNRSEEPIQTDEDLARHELDDIADAFLMHNRIILNRADDSLVRVVSGKTYPIHRARGYAPNPLSLPKDGPPILAVGGELNSTFCLTKNNLGFMSPHIGDLENHETLQAFETAVAEFERINRCIPELIVADQQSDYLSSQYASERARIDNIELLNVQHHHAHIAACMADRGLDGSEPVIGVAFDGTGLGTDGAIWGGEFLIADYSGFERSYHLKYVPLIGGDKATVQINRLGYAWLQEIGFHDTATLPSFRALTSEERQILDKLVAAKVNSPLTSSMGRLFDAIASIIGLRQTVNYEAQAAIELEAIANPDETVAYPFEICGNELDPYPLIKCLAADYLEGVDPPTLAGRFHTSISRMVVQVCNRLRHLTGIEQVALSGGVWQNRLLLEQTVFLLENSGFNVITHQQVPANDGGLALGQAVIAQKWIAEKRGLIEEDPICV